MTINWSTFLLEILNFLVLLWILKHFLYRPVLEVIARRKAAVEKTLADAASRENTARDLQARYQGRLDEWEKEKEAAHVELARQIDAERTSQLAALKASLAAERQSQEAAAQRAAQQQRLAMEREAVRHGAHFATSLLQDVAGPEVNVRLVERALQELASLPADRVATLRGDFGRDGSTARVVSAYPLDEAVRARIGAAVAVLTGSKVAPEFTTDAKLLAGMRIELGTWSLGANLSDELVAFADLDDGR